MNIVEKEIMDIENMIYEIRGKQVMLDSDLARLYKTETKRINESVRRNNEKFPERFSFILDDSESKKLLVANCDQKNETRGGKFKNPRVFTEQGVAMLATILKTPIATKTSIAIMDAFVEMKKYISINMIEQQYIIKQVLRNTDDIKLLQESFNKLQNNKSNDGLFFEGQIYDSYSLMIDIFNTARNKIIIFDNYIDKIILDILRNIEKEVLIITNKYNNEDYEKYKEQYFNVRIKINNKIHDRFIIIDNKELYHCGASLKDIGKKCFAITKIDNGDWLTNILKLI